VHQLTSSSIFILIEKNVDKTQVDSLAVFNVSCHKNRKSKTDARNRQDRSRKSEVRSRKSEVRSRKSEVQSRKSEVRNRKSEVGSLKYEVERQFEAGWDKTRKRNAERNDGSGFRKRIPQMRIKRRIAQKRLGTE
jgi:hypothetical protein